MTAEALIDGLDQAIDALETALDAADPHAIGTASETLAAALAPLSAHDFRSDDPVPALRLSAALARIESLRVRIAVVADLDRRRAHRAGDAQTYGPGGRLRMISSR